MGGILGMESGHAQVYRKGTSESPEARAAFEAKYRREAEPFLERIEKSFSSKSVTELIAMLAPNEPVLSLPKAGSYKGFRSSNDEFVYYLVCRDGNRRVFKELSKRAAIEGETLQQFANDPTADAIHIFTGSSGPFLTVRMLCETLLVSGKYP